MNIYSMLPSWMKLRPEGRIPEIPAHWDREAFVPIHTADLVRLLSDKVAERGQNPKHFRLLCRLILSVLHHQYRKRHESLTHLYSILDPDRVTRIPFAVNNQERDECSKQLFDGLGDILERGNYRRLSPKQIESAVSATSHWGVRLQIAFSKFRRLEVYARGDVVGKRWRRRLFKRYEVDVPLYQRLVVIFRSKDEENFEENLDPSKIHMRMFKNIPKIDVDMILPGASVKLNWIDRGKIGIPTLWGFLMFVSRFVRNATILALLGIIKIVASAALIIGVVLALVYYSIISIFRYATARQRYLLNVAQSLYYQNLDNNGGVLLRLLDEAEQQEACETIVAYFVLSDPNLATAMSIEEVDRQAEQLLYDLCATRIDFDVEDAIRDLVALRLVTVDDTGWRGRDMTHAIRELDNIWDKYFLVPQSEYEALSSEGEPPSQPA